MPQLRYKDGVPLLTFINYMQLILSNKKIKPLIWAKARDDRAAFITPALRLGLVKEETPGFTQNKI